MIKAGVYGAQGDIAAALIKTLVFHPDVNLTWVMDQNPPRPLNVTYRSLTGDTSLITTQELPSLDEVDVVFIAAEPRPPFVVNELPETVKIIDLTGIYRFDEQFTYGLPEINRKFMVHDCFKVACPSDVANVIELALLPLAKNLMVNSNVTATATSSQDFNTSRIELEIQRLVGGVQNSFNNNVHIERIGSSHDIVTVVRLRCNTALDVVESIYNDYFDDHNFTFIIDTTPQAQDVRGTNKCLMHLQRDNDELVVTAAIDPVLKGAVGTAVHCMNLMFGLHERVGLETF